VYAVNALTISLGGGIVPADLALTQDGDALVLLIGASDSIRFTRRFETNPQAWPQITLQMFGSVHFYDFNAVIAEFQAALAADPLLNGFALDGVLQNHETSVSETEALGGALAYQYGTTGSLNGMGDAAIRQVLGGENFGSGLQSVEVPGGNQAPVVAVPLQDHEAQEDALFTFTLPAEAFTDADADDVLDYSAFLASDGPLPPWLAFDAGSRTFSGTPANGDVGDIAVRVTATDPSGASVSDDFDVTVTNTNDAPTINVPIADQSATVGIPFGLALPGNAFVDFDQGEILTYSASLANADPLPEWLGFDPGSLSFIGTPGAWDAGALSVRVTATDVAGEVAIDEFEILVSENAQGVHLVGTPANDELTGTEHDDVLEGLEGRDQLSGLGGDDKLIGGRGRDRFFGGDGQDMLFGDRGRDTLHGGAGDDLLAGGRGNDRLEAGVGDDIYVHEQHGGHDVIAETGGTDSLSFGRGIAPGMARLRRHHNDLVVELSGPHGSVTVEGWFVASGAKKVEVIRFDDGTTWNTEEILDRATGYDAWWHGDDRGNRHADRSDSYHGKAHGFPKDSDDDSSRRGSDPIAEYLAAYLADRPRYGFEALAQDLEASAREGGETLTAGEIARRWQQVARFGAGLASEQDENARGAGNRLALGMSADLALGGNPGHANSTGAMRDGADLRTFTGLQEGFHHLQS
jgi:Ca2+-binding RTX toxin-like protein